MAMSKKVKQTITLFVVTFFVSLIVITYFIKSMSPNVDVEIGGDESQSYEHDDSQSDVKQAIDDRLRWIQMEDNMPGVSKRDDGLSDDIEYEHTETVKTTKISDKKVEKQEQKEEENTLEPIEYVNPQKPIAQPPVPLQSEPFKMSKVYVGSYPTIEQAIQAQNKLMNTNVSVSPFVKEVNGAYVLQAGSYANATKADAVAKEINSVGFNARVVRE